MGNRSNKVLIGVIVLLIGFISLVQNSMGMNYAAIAVAGAGLAFLLLYKTKRKIWSLLLGLYMSCVGVFGLLSPFVPPYVMARLVASMCFFVPGVIFIVLFYQKSKAAFLVTGSLLSWIGVFIALASLPVFKQTGPGLFLICAGFGFFMMFLFGKDLLGKFPKYVGLILCLVGLISMSGLFPGMGLLRRLRTFGSVILMGVSIYIIAKAIRKE